jgi:hypothetical protein
MSNEFIPGRTPAAVTTIATGYLRMTVERVACAATGGHLHIRMTPADVPAGVPIGPRVGMELHPEHARDLAALLVAQADAMEAAR